MERFLEQLKLRDEIQNAGSDSADLEEKEISRLKRELEMQVEIERCLTRECATLLYPKFI